MSDLYEMFRLGVRTFYTIENVPCVRSLEAERKIALLLRECIAGCDLTGSSLSIGTSDSNLAKTSGKFYRGNAIKKLF